MNKDIKIIFVDIDWTIYNHQNGDHVFDVESVNALKEAQKNGVKVVINTARPHHSIRQTGLLDLITPDGFICANGGLVVLDGKVIYQTKMDKDVFNKLCEVALSHGLTLEAVEPFSSFLIKEKTDFVDKVFAVYYEELPPVKDYHDKDDILGVMLFANEELDETLKNEIPSCLNYFRFHPFGVDVVSLMHLKGNGVKIVLDYLKLNKDNALAFGDDLGDISMFDEVKYSVCMDNGRDEAKSHAVYIAPPVWESGVKQVLKQLKVID